MIPLVDTHCHLLAGLDDGARTEEEAVEMCRVAWEDGTRVIAAVAHVNEQWPDVTADRIRAATEQLKVRLKRIGLPLSVHPCAEVTIRPGLQQMWAGGELLSVADRNAYLLVELPANTFLDLRDMIRHFTETGIRPILAHPERHPELLHQPGAIEELIELGCLVQAASESVCGSLGREGVRVLKRWVRKGIVHLVGSDGHSATLRAPRMAEAYRCITRWAGASTANRICSINGLAVLEGLPLRVRRPERPKRDWFSRLAARCRA